MEELFPSWPNKDRAMHYRQQAAKLRKMADAETADEIMREQLIALADQYTRLVDRLLAKKAD